MCSPDAAAEDEEVWEEGSEEGALNELDEHEAALAAGHPIDDGSYDPDMIPGIETGDHVVEFYAKYGQDSAVKFFYCNR